ncbi:MAG TPA: ArsC/Spx/MgsR family protein [Puia sp.]|jgi:arsenate reductase|nr:ArsC/Spx/MgsR family protein [Puia sp.]
MKKLYHLSSCTTCQRILKETGAAQKGFVLQDIKTQPITPAQLDEMKEKAGSYEALFSRRALKYKELGLKDQKLTEADYRRLILEEYTFLKRPVVVAGKRLFAGSEKATVAALKVLIDR